MNDANEELPLQMNAYVVSQAYLEIILPVWLVIR